MTLAGRTKGAISACLTCTQGMRCCGSGQGIPPRGGLGRSGAPAGCVCVTHPGYAIKTKMYQLQLLYHHGVVVSGMFQTCPRCPCLLDMEMIVVAHRTLSMYVYIDVICTVNSTRNLIDLTGKRNNGSECSVTSVCWPR